MKIRLFCFLSAVFMFVGLLLPSGVYALDGQVDSPVVTVESGTEGSGPATCTNSTKALTSVAPVTEDGEPTVVEPPAEPCQEDDNNNPAPVSWNS